MADHVHEPAKPWEAILITTMAGACTILGGLSLFLVRRFKPIPMTLVLGIAAGVMTWVTMVEIVPQALIYCQTGIEVIEVTKAQPKSDRMIAGLGSLMGTSFVLIGWLGGTLISWGLSSCLNRYNMVGTSTFDKEGNLVKRKTQNEESLDVTERTVTHLESAEDHVTPSVSDEVLPTGVTKVMDSTDPTMDKSDMEGDGWLEVSPEALRRLYTSDGSWDGKKAIQSLIEEETGVTRFLLQMKRTFRETEYVKYQLANAAFRREQSRFLHIGFFTAIALGIHNIPEGMATYTSYMEDKNFGYGMAFAIAVHNIPEGIAVAIPCYFGTGSAWRALGLCSLSAVAEPVGGLIAMGLNALTDSVILDGILLSLIAGFMLRVALAELLLTGMNYDPTNIVIVKALLLGMVIMAYSMVLFEFIAEHTH